MSYLKKTMWGLIPVMAVGLAGVSYGQDQINLLEFLAAPSSQSSSELVFTSNGLTNGTGTIGTGFQNPSSGDGTDPLVDQDATGLLATSPFTVTGIPGGVFNTGGGGESTFFDVTMILSELAPTAPVSSQSLTGFPTDFLIQPLGDGQIEIWSTDPDLGTGGEILLLAATLSNAVLSGLENFQSGSVVSASLVYTGGEVLTQAGFAPGTRGELSFSLIDIEPSLTINPTNGFLNAFEADATGLFTIIPEPSSALLLISAGSLLAMRRRQP